MKQKLWDLRGLQTTEDLVEQFQPKMQCYIYFLTSVLKLKRKVHHFLTLAFRCVVAGQVGVTLGSGRGGIRDSFCSSIL